MATQTRARSSERAARKPKLPEIDVARFEEVGRLLEVLVEENTRLFVAKGQQYRDAHRDGTRRTLTAREAVELAAAVVDDRPLEDVAAALQNHEGLYAYDQPERPELLVAAGVSTAPAFVQACRKVVALLEMPTSEFWEALDDGRLDEAIDEGAERLRRVGLTEARERTVAALDHFAAEAGDAGGKGFAAIAQAIWQALKQAMRHLGDLDDRAFSSLIASPEPTPGPAATSSASPTATPSS